MLDRVSWLVKPNDVGCVSSDKELVAVNASEFDTAVLSVEDPKLDNSLEAGGGFGNSSAALRMRSISS